MLPRLNTNPTPMEMFVKEGSKPPITTDPINPSHYKMYNGFEVIQVVEQMSSPLLSHCAKYLLRAGKKEGSSEIQDLKKAQWYLTRRISKLEAIGKIHE